MSRSRLLSWGLSVLLSSAAALAAPPPPAASFVRGVTVLGGNAVRGVEDGVILQRQLDGSCPPPASALPMSPFAASLGAEVRLALEIAPCAATAPPPAVECSLQWSGGGPPAGPQRFTGWRGTLALALPAATGIYDLQLQCSVAGREETFRSRFYLTYAPPREPVLPPREEWYRMACEWGAGLRAGDLESLVARMILDGIYQHGQRRWRYGYCTFGEDDTCRFAPTAPPATPACVFKVSEALGRCEWPCLVGGDVNCNFTDCVGYSSMFQYIAETMGIGGFERMMVRGSTGQGFWTHGWLRSLDPKALGNLLCGERDLQCSFLFSVHDLRKRKDLIYDSTFGQIYNDLGGLIAANILAVEKSLVVTNRMRACAVLGQPYGAFTPWNELPLGVFGCPRDSAQPAVFAAADSRLPAADLELVSTTGDARPEVLKITLEVEVRRAGPFSVGGVLLGGSKGDQVAGARPSDHVSTYSRFQLAERPPGRYPVTLWFSGEDLAASRVAGPYLLEAFLVTPQGISDEITKTLPAVSLEGLGERVARLGEISRRAERIVIPQGGTALRVRLPVIVRDAGLFVVDARLSSGDSTLAYSGVRRELSPGEQTIDVDFPGEAIARRGIDGSYDLTVELHLLDPHSLDPIEMVDSAKTTLDPLVAADFR